ncbi:MAG: tetratricopeptide repeat protein [Raineya sp.]|nr:tetratricopeptide repeat protein [Raineya sp.]MDW8297614.1 tetratricopeptide repeat protein [Raineya sp.]
MKPFYAFCGILLVMLLNPATIWAQDKKIDSLENLLKSQTVQDTNQLNTLVQLGRLYSKKDLSKSFAYAKQAESLAQKLKNIKGEANALQIMGVVEDLRANYKDAIRYMEKSLELNRKINSQKGIASCLNNLGIYYFKQGDYLNSIKRHSESVVIKEKLGDELGIISSNINIGVVYDQLKDYEKARDYFQKALAVAEKNEDYAEQHAAVLFNLAALATNEGNFEESLKLNQKALEIRKTIQDEVHLPESLRALGEVYTALKNYPTAKKHLDEALKTAEEIGDKLTMAVGYSSIGDWYEAQKQYAKACEFHIKGYELAKEIGAKHVLRDAAEDLKKNYLELGDFKSANAWGVKLIQHQKEILSEDMQKEFSRLEGKLELERKLAQEQREREIQAEREAKERERQNNLQYSAILIALVSAFLIVVGFLRRTMPTSVVENITFFILLIFFEFVLVFLDPFISQYTNGFPLLTLTANVIVALAFMPIHRGLEKALKKRLTPEKYAARLGVEVEAE